MSKQLTVRCDGCSITFQVPASLAGGLSNCPQCQRATKVTGAAEHLFWGLVGGAAFLVLGLAAFLHFMVHPVAGLVTLVIGGIIIVVVVVAS